MGEKSLKNWCGHNCPVPEDMKDAFLDPSPVVFEIKGFADYKKGKLLDLSAYVNHRVQIKGTIEEYWSIEAEDSHMEITTTDSAHTMPDVWKGIPRPGLGNVLKTTRRAIKDLGRVLRPQPEDRMLISSTSLESAIRVLARQASVNCVFDPKLSVSSPEYPTGGILGEELEGIRFEHVTALQAFTWIIKEHGLKLVENPATPVVRITGLNEPERKNDGRVLGRDTNDVPHLIHVEDRLPLRELIMKIAGQAGLKVTVDATIGVPGVLPNDELMRRTNNAGVYVQLDHVTARQALIALCDNYDLVMVKDSKTGGIRFKARGK